MKYLAMLALFALTFMGGCSWFQSVATPTNINTVVYNASYFGLKAVLSNNPARAATICKDVTTAVGLINTNLLNPPNGLFAGGTGSAILAGGLQTALASLDAALPANAVDAVNVGLVLLEGAVTLPALPTDALSSTAVADLTAGFHGLSLGLSQAVAEWQAANPAPVVTPSTPPVMADKMPVKAHLVTNQWKH